MLQAFVGIVSQRGIELLCPEDPATERFLWRRAKREPGRVACIWCVLPHDALPLIETALDMGLSLQALQLLQQRAYEYGFLYPHQDDLFSRTATGYFR